MGHYLCGVKCEVFCERPFELRRQQRENDKQNVDVVPPWKNFCGRPCQNDVSFAELFPLGGRNTQRLSNQ